MIKILANDGIDSNGKAILESAGFHVETTKVPQEQLAEALKNYDAVLVRSATKIKKDIIEAWLSEYVNVRISLNHSYLRLIVF